MPALPFHNQDCDVYCGPACLMMMLQSQSLPPDGTDSSRPDPADIYQVDLMTEVVIARIKAGLVNPNEWQSSPEAMVAAANDRLQLHGSSVRYSIFPARPHPKGDPGPPDQSFEEAIHVSTEETGAPVFVLTRSGEHWILVSKGSRGNKKYGSKFKSCNPDSLGNAEGTRVAHNEVCTVCKARGRNTALTEKGLFDRFTPVAGKSDGYNGQRILLIPARLAAPPPVAPAPPPAAAPAPLEAAPAPPEAAAIPGIEPPDTPAPWPTEPGAEPEKARLQQARDTVEREIADFRDLFEEHGEHFDKARVGTAIRVEHPTAPFPEGSYYLVPIFSGVRVPESEPYFVAQVCGVSGAFLAIDCIREAQPNPDCWIYKLLNEDELESKIAREMKEYIPRTWHSNYRLVWQFCRQSLSPMEPFHELIRDGKPGYMDKHGIVHPTLELPRSTHAQTDPAPLPYAP